jgi:hypothetical protein
MLAGGQSKTSNHKITFWWPTEGDRRDFALFSKVGTWIGQNTRVLDKKSVVDVIQLVLEQFPELSAAEAQDFAGRMARSVR